MYREGFKFLMKGLSGYETTMYDTIVSGALGITCPTFRIKCKEEIMPWIRDKGRELHNKGTSRYRELLTPCEHVHCWAVTGCVSFGIAIAAYSRCSCL